LLGSRWQTSHANFVLIADVDEVTHVDSGYPAGRDLVEPSVRGIGRSLSGVTAMLLTHAHVDHISGQRSGCAVLGELRLRNGRLRSPTWLDHTASP
jgi:glyoxylase-like metal-dependent hydrolase (beta-lactamase superfamily II)